LEPYPSTRAAALARLDAFLADAPRYAARRNDVVPGHPYVSRLSAALRHRLLTEQEVVEATLRRHPFRVVEKFLQEVLWRGYWRGWLERRPHVWDRAVEEAAHLEATLSPDARRSAQAALEGRSGEPLMDLFARELLDTGYLHNHARMWWASFWVHHLRLPWALGARHFSRHLLDFDAASNTLSWRWVAGLQTPGKTYMVTAENLRRYCAPELLAQAGHIGLNGATIARPQIEPESPAPRTPGPTAPVPRTAARLSARSVVVLHDEDLCLELSPLAGARPHAVAHLAPLAASDTPAPRAAWLERARADAATRAAAHFGCSIHRCDSLDAVLNVCGTAEADSLAMMAPAVGPLRDTLQGLYAQAAARDVQVVAITRAWDSALAPYATRGFFPFWAEVGPRLEKTGSLGA
jgi:deoxyribodipyrimidine photo-lyase